MICETIFVFVLVALACWFAAMIIKVYDAQERAMKILYGHRWFQTSSGATPLLSVWEREGYDSVC